MNFDKMLHMFFPNRCVCCGGVVTAEETVCEECAPHLNKVEGKLCKTCGAPENSCNCKRHPKWFDRCVSPFYYNDSAKAAILNIKHRNNKQAVNFFAKYMTQWVLSEYCNERFDCIVFVPMYKSKQRKNGYNHSELLARAVSKCLGVPIISALKQTVKTTAQHLLPAKEREQNVSGIYAAVTDVYDKNILLIDDIITTGSTLSECARVLKLAGARSVYCVAAATSDKSKQK